MMHTEHTEITAAMEAITRRETGHKRMARVILPLLGIVMIAVGIVGLGVRELLGLRLTALMLSGLFYILSYSTLICGQWTIGMIPQAGIGAYFFILAALWPVVCALPGMWQWAAWAVFSLAGSAVLFFIGILIVMFVGSVPPRHRGEYTLMILGCKLKNGRPGRMLRRRLDKAVSELERHGGIMCVVSGGRAPDQPLAEAEAMAAYLTEKGIAPERIIVEKLSSTTYENFLFSKELLTERGLPCRVGVVSDRFHQFRSGRIARTAQMDSFPVSCRTAWYLAVQFWMRDALCILERIIKGHW